MHPRRRTLLCALAAALVAACSGTQRSPDPALPPVTPIMLPPAMPANASPELIGPPWRWQGTGSTRVGTPERYTIEFTSDGRALVQADCNRGSGRYVLESDGRLTLTPIATTKMGCPSGSLDTTFLRQLGEAQRVRLDADGLQLALRDGGAMRFAR